MLQQLVILTRLQDYATDLQPSSNNLGSISNEYILSKLHFLTIVL